jgi:cell division protein FtsQ
VRTAASTPAGRKRASARAARARSAQPARRRAPAGARSGARPAARRHVPKKRVVAKRRKPSRPKPHARRSFSLPRLGSWRRRAILLVVAAGALAAGYFGWFRDSSLVAVQDVRVEGAQGADRGQIVAALTEAAKGMTTLHVQSDRLETAVRPFPAVASVSADPSFPHALTVHVTERQPTLVVRSGDRQVPAAADGSLLPGVQTQGGLPAVPVDSIPQSARLTGDALQEALAVGAAPAPLRPLIDKVAMDSDYGVVVMLHGGIELRFGTGQRAPAKWTAATAILADDSVTGFSYLDLRVPERPAVGGT